MVSAENKIPVTVIVATRNEETRIQKCLAALSDFGEVAVVDSASTDATKEISARMGAKVFDFVWNGQYPKKRQWCLDNLPLKHDWVFFVDADEIVTLALVDEMRGINFACAGYFVKGLYIYEGKTLRYGLKNNKLCLLDRTKMHFPVIDDIGAPGMGEIEGHYQPVLKSSGEIGQLKNVLIHDAYDDPAGWQARHERYAAWEREMNRRGAWPREVNALRAMMKKVFRSLPFRPLVAFVHCYFFKFGFLDGMRGFRFARDRYRYYRMI